jgi:hypothetical protein
VTQKTRVIRVRREDAELLDALCADLNCSQARAFEVVLSRHRAPSEPMTPDPLSTGAPATAPTPSDSPSVNLSTSSLGLTRIPVPSYRAVPRVQARHGRARIASK